MAPEETESSLIARAVARDPDAFGQLYSLYFDRIYRYARLKLGNPTDAEDVTAAVFLSAWRAIDRFTPKHESSFAGWLFRLAHNALVDRFRRARPVVSLETALDAAEATPTLAGPEAAMDWRLTLLDLHQALQQLTEDQREVVLLRFVEGLSAREVGDIMGKQEGTVRGLQFRAIEALRRALAYVQGRRPHNGR